MGVHTDVPSQLKVSPTSFLHFHKDAFSLVQASASLPRSASRTRGQPGVCSAATEDSPANGTSIILVRRTSDSRAGRKFAWAPGGCGVHGSDLPPLNGTTPRARFCQCQNQRRAFHATRNERTGRADHPYAASVEVEVGRGKTVAESVKKIGVTEQTYS